MSTQPTPLDALMAKIDELVAHAREDERLCYDQVPSQRYADLRDDLRAILEKWGTPATGGEPVACNCKATDMRLGVCCKVRAAFEEWYDQQQDGRIQPFDVWLAAWKGGRKSVGTSPQPVREPLSDEMVTAGARVLNQRLADECNINKDDQWAIYADDFKEEARAVLLAAHGITGGQHGTER